MLPSLISLMGHAFFENIIGDRVGWGGGDSYQMLPSLISVLWHARKGMGTLFLKISFYNGKWKGGGHSLQMLSSLCYLMLHVVYTTFFSLPVCHGVWLVYNNNEHTLSLGCNPIRCSEWVHTEILETNHSRRCIIMLCDYYPILYYIDAINMDFMHHWIWENIAKNKLVT